MILERSGRDGPGTVSPWPLPADPLPWAAGVRCRECPLSAVPCHRCPFPSAVSLRSVRLALSKDGASGWSTVAGKSGVPATPWQMPPRSGNAGIRRSLCRFRSGAPAPEPTRLALAPADWTPDHRDGFPCIMPGYGGPARLLDDGHYCRGTGGPPPATFSEGASHRGADPGPRLRLSGNPRLRQGRPQGSAAGRPGSGRGRPRGPRGWDIAGMASSLRTRHEASLSVGGAGRRGGTGRCRAVQGRVAGGSRRSSSFRGPIVGLPGNAPGAIPFRGGMPPRFRPFLPSPQGGTGRYRGCRAGWRGGAVQGGGRVSAAFFVPRAHRRPSGKRPGGDPVSGRHALAFPAVSSIAARRCRAVQGRVAGGSRRSSSFRGLTVGLPGNAPGAIPFRGGMPRRFRPFLPSLQGRQGTSRRGLPGSPDRSRLSCGSPKTRGRRPGHPGRPGGFAARHMPLRRRRRGILANARLWPAEAELGRHPLFLTPQAANRNAQVGRRSEGRWLRGPKRSRLAPRQAGASEATPWACAGSHESVAKPKASEAMQCVSAAARRPVGEAQRSGRLRAAFLFRLNCGEARNAALGGGQGGSVPPAL
jgi:hypothetical protein